MERLYVHTPLGDISYLHRDGIFPVIFLHGLGGSSNNWLKLAPLFPEKYRLIIPDLLGHGKSTRHADYFTISDQVEFLGHLLGSLKIDESGFVGNSYGGWVSMRYALSRGKSRFLVLIDSAGINKTLGEEPPEVRDQFVRKVMDMNPANDPDIIGKMLAQNATGTERINPQELTELPEDTLIIWGEGDRIIDRRYSEELHKGIPGSRLRTIPDAGHTPHSTHPAVVSGFILDFLENLGI
ncbi:MAG: alpha/beta fold hydrolase [Candidatus Thermoplasmatota archaeon]|nr:alpha/beta fold hydrolase [Candidatus Thermoplasmatota archaeon]